MRSLRAQLLLGTAAAAAIVLLASSSLLYVLISRALWSEFDAALASKATALAAMAEQDGDRLELEFDETRLPEYEPSDQAEYYQVWLSGGEVFSRSRSLGSHDLELIAGAEGTHAFKAVTLPDGRAGRIAGLRFAPRQESDSGRADQPADATLVVGRGTAGIATTLARVRLLLVAVCLFAVSASVGLLAWFVRRGLRPVGRLGGQIARVDARDLGARLDDTGVPAELMPVVDRLNDLLARLEAAFQRERRFTADVAHELRTPLAGVRSILEVSLSKPRERDSYQDSLSECLAVNEQMQRLVDNLLNLARADAGQIEIVREAVSPSDLIRECWVNQEEQARRRGLVANWHLDGVRTIETDRELLRVIVSNVLQNAVSYADSGSPIEVSTSEVSTSGDDARTEISVSNSAQTLAATDVEHLFERFWRADDSRRATGTHCGLGLPLCKTLVERLGGSIAASSDAERNLRVTIRLPHA